MKYKSLKIVLLGLLLSDFSVLKAESPVNASCCDSVSTPGNSYSPLAIQNYLPPVTVNENEIRAGLLYDVVNKKVVWQKDMNNAYPIASLTKMMVALLAMEDIKNGKIGWDDRIQWTRELLVGRRKSRKTIFTNVNYSVRDVFKAAMIASNNECAEQLARYIGGGNLQATIERMNSRAVELNMVSTYFTNPTGLPASHSMFDNRSTPSDLLNLTLEMLKYKEVLEISAMGYASIENGKSSTVISNHNKLTIEYSGEVDGLKTGYTRRAGFCLVATTAKCDHRLVSIVLGCRGPQIRNEIVRDMVNDYYTSISLDKLGTNYTEPYASVVNSGSSNGKDGRYVTIYEQVRKVHVVKKGENISTIASRYKCTTAQLKNWNKNGIKKNYLYSGQKLMVYVNQPRNILIDQTANGNESDDDKLLISDNERQNLENSSKQTPASEPLSEIKKVKTPAKYLYHTVVPGDTLFKISMRYQGTSVEQLKSLNNIPDNGSLIPGTKLKIKVQA